MNERIRSSCETCRAATVHVQRPSLLTAAVWLQSFAFADPGTETREPEPLVLARFTPCCAELRCSAAVRRDADQGVVAAATAHVQATFAPVGEEDPQIKACLAKMALRWAMSSAPIAETASLSVSEAAGHALLLANNLVYQAHPAVASSPAVIPGNVALSSEFSLSTLERLVHDAAETERREVSGDDWNDPAERRSLDPSYTAGDVIVIHLLRGGLERLFAFVESYQAPKVQVTYVTRSKTLAILLSLGGLLLAAALVAQNLWLGVAGGLALLAPLFFLSPRRVESRAPALAWAVRLSRAAASEGHEALLRRFLKIDLLGAAANQFSGTRWADPQAAAATLRALHGTPGADMVLPRLARDLVRPAVVKSFAPSAVLWLAALGERLLDHDGFLRGTEVAGLLFTELLHAAPERGADAAIWTILGTENDPANGMPHFFARLLRRAVGLHHGRHAWSTREGRFVERCRAAVVDLLTRPPLESRSAHLMLIRMVRGLLTGRAAAELPPDCGCTIEGLCRRVEDLHSAYLGTDTADPIVLDCKSVMELPAFLASGRSLAAGRPPAEVVWTPGRRTSLDSFVYHWANAANPSMPGFGPSWEPNARSGGTRAMATLPPATTVAGGRPTPAPSSKPGKKSAPIKRWKKNNKRR